MLKKQLQIGYTIIDALQLAVLLVPAFFLNDLLSLNCSFILTFILILCVLGVLFGIVICDCSKKRAVIKGLISIPFDVLFWCFLIHIQFSVRGFHWLSPEYGDKSAGDNFAGFALLCINLLCHFVGLIAGIGMSGKHQSKKAERIMWIMQRVVSPIICIGIITAIVILNAIMPPYFSNFG
ncbi:MAG: hypothetical protein ACI4M3_06585 [Acutalibacteraceae bacterium]